MDNSIFSNIKFLTRELFFYVLSGYVIYVNLLFSLGKTPIYNDISQLFEIINKDYFSEIIFIYILGLLASQVGRTLLSKCSNSQTEIEINIFLNTNPKAIQTHEYFIDRYNQLSKTTRNLAGAAVTSILVILTCLCQSCDLTKTLYQLLINTILLIIFIFANKHYRDQEQKRINILKKQLRVKNK